LVALMTEPPEASEQGQVVQAVLPSFTWVAPPNSSTTATPPTHRPTACSHGQRAGEPPVLPGLQRRLLQPIRHETLTSG
jgi:hypothetical protein